VEQVGSPLALYRHPCNRFVAGFIGSPTMNFLESELIGGSHDGAAVRLAGGADVRVGVAASDAGSGARVTLGIRPEHIVLGESDNGDLAGQVIYSEHLGDQTLVYLEIPGADTPLTVRIGPDTEAEEGRMLKVGLPANACHLFDGQGTAFRRLAHAANRAG
jgi:multiple sugar transport system ATP-binding protein